MEGNIIKSLDETLALYKSFVSDGVIFIVLYDCTKPFDINCIRGIVEVKVDLVGTQRIHSSDKVIAAKGYGPLMYLIAIDNSGVNGLTSDLTGKTSQAAERVWKEFYDGKGSKLVDSMPFVHPTRDEAWFNVRHTSRFIVQGLDAAIARHPSVDLNIDEFLRVSKSFLEEKIQQFR
jgi:hypothetical protein